MIKNHKIELVLSIESEVYQKIEEMAMRKGASVEDVLELMIAKGLSEHLENNLEWAETLSAEVFKAHKS